jgi:hypothetical protein
MKLNKIMVALLVSAVGLSPAAVANSELAELRAEVDALKKQYEASSSGSTKQNKPTVYSNRFNPSIGLLLNGGYRSYTAAHGDIAGFAVGHEGHRKSEGFAIGESELAISASVDDKFYGRLTAAIVREDGEDKVELEEAYVQTLPGFGLLDGLTAKFGRAFWTFGYLNEHHLHAHDFADRPLPNRAFLNGAFNDDGAELTYVLPTQLYTELGGGIFRGDDMPFGGATGDKTQAWSAFVRVGDDIGYNQSWRVGAYRLASDAVGRFVENEEEVSNNTGFYGHTALDAVDVRYTWAMTGNPRQQELIVQGEYFWQHNDGNYKLGGLDAAANAGNSAIYTNAHATGWYLQTVYKLAPQWRVGVRYSELSPAAVPTALKTNEVLDANGHNPRSTSAMLDWTNSEFSRIRFQYNHNVLANNQSDDQFIVQYVMSIGAHGAHKY